MQPITAFQAHAGRTILTWLADPRLCLVGPEDPPPGRPDIVVFPAGQTIDFAAAPPALSRTVAASLAGGHGVVVFDSAQEAWKHHPQRTRMLHQFAEQLGVPASRCVYLTQDRGYEAEYARERRTDGGEAMKVVVADHWIRRLLAAHAEDGEAALAHRRKCFKRRELVRQRRFLSLNLTPRPTKVLFLLRLMRDGLWDRGFVTFGGFDRVAGRNGRSREELERSVLAERGFEDLATELGPLLPELGRMGPVVLGPGSSELNSADLALDLHLSEYDASWFSVVTETEMRYRPVRITEKTLKPLLNFHPMLVLGDPGALALVRHMGFRTFGEWIDERYDEEPDRRRRFEMVYQELRRLCALSEAEMKRMEKAAAETLAFNAEWGLVQLPKLHAERLDAALIDAILATSRPPRAA